MEDNYEKLKTLKEIYDNYIPLDNDNFRISPLDEIYKFTKQGQPIPEIKLNDRFRFNNLIFDLDDTLYFKTEQLGDDYSFEDIDNISIPSEDMDYLKELSGKNNCILLLTVMKNFKEKKLKF